MKVSQLLHLILVTICVTTLLLTLITGLLHKWRQVSGASRLRSPAKKSAGVECEGTYFRRYFPYAISVQKSAEPVHVNLRVSFQKPAVFLVLISGVIFCALMLPNCASRARNEWEHAELAKKNQSLIHQGLLQSYSYSAEGRENALDEYITPIQKSRQLALISGLNQKRVVLFTGGESVSSLLGWKLLFARLGIRYQTTDDLQSAEKMDLLILPQIRTLDSEDEDWLLGQEKRGLSILASGPFGVKALSEDRVDTRLASALLGVKFIRNPEAKKFYPTVFANAPGSPGWEVPSGIHINWDPLDNEFSALGVLGQSGAFEATHENRIRYITETRSPIVRAQFRQSERARAVWLALDPVHGAEQTVLNPAERFYSDDALLSSLAWAAKVPMVRPTSWKEGARSAAIYSVDSEDRFENVEPMITLLNKHEFPATFFVVSQLLSESPSTFEKRNPRMELVSHSDDHSIFENQPGDLQFNRIQASRHEIESISHARVSGFRPPEERYDSETIHAAYLNRLDYFFGDRRFVRLAPVWVHSGKLLFFPRALIDDFVLHSQSGLAVHPEQVVQKVMQDFHEAELLGGHFLFSSHTQIFGQSEYLPAIDGILSSINQAKDLWKTNFSELYLWWNQRSALKLRVEHLGTEWFLVAENTSNSPNSGMIAEVDLGTGVKRLRLPELQSGQEVRIMIP